MRARSSRVKPERRRNAGLSLLETATLISLCGVLTAAFVPTFVRHVRVSKIAEATEELESLYQHAAAYYEASHTVDKRLLQGCLPQSAGPTPSEPNPDPAPVDFAAPGTEGRETWLALGRTEPRSLRYSYQVIVAQAGCGPRTAPVYPALILRAIGDLDGDGVRSTVERSAGISSDRRTLVPAPILRVTQRVE